MSKLIDIHDLQDRIDEALASATRGDDVIITEGNTPLARLVPIASKLIGKRVAGLHEGAIEVAPDFNDELSIS